MGEFSVVFHCEIRVLRELYRSGVTLGTNDRILFSRHAVMFVVASGDRPTLLLPLRLNIQRIGPGLSCRDITDSHNKADLVGNGFLKVPPFYSCRKTKSKVKAENVRAVCLCRGASSAHFARTCRQTSRTRTHTQTHAKNKTLVAFGLLLIAGHMSSL